MSSVTLRPLPLCLLLAACASEQGLHHDEVPVAPAAVEAPSSPPEVHQFLDDTTLTDGIVLSREAPFQSVTAVWSGGPDAALEVRVLDGEPGPWVPVEVVEAHGPHRSGLVILERPVEQLEVRSNEPLRFAQLDLHEGSEPVYDDDPGPSGSLEAGRAQAGMWVPPHSTWLIGQGVYFPYVGASGCSGSLRPGSKALGEYLVAHFAATTFQGYNCRKIGGSNAWSVHSTGRALDVFVPTDGWGANSADNDLGDPIANWLIENAAQIGISYFIWDRASWGAHRIGDKHRSYGGVHPHNDHLHIELTEAAASKSTPWFTGPQPAPSVDTSDRERLAVAENADGRLEVFYLTDTGAIFHQWQVTPGGAWSGGFELGGQATDLATLRWDDGHLELFYVGLDGQVWHTWQLETGGWFFHSPLGGQDAVDVEVALNADGRPEIFIVEADGEVRHNWWTGAGWSGFWPMNGTNRTDLAVGTNHDGRLEVFTVDAAGAIFHEWQVEPNGTWSGSWPMEHHGRDPKVARNADGRLELFYRDGSGEILHDWQTSAGGAWSGGWTMGLSGTEHAVATNADGRLEIFFTGHDGRLYHDWQVAPNAGWTGGAWLLGGNPAHLEVTTNHDGRLEAFWLAPDRSLWHQWWHVFDWSGAWPM